MSSRAAALPRRLDESLERLEQGDLQLQVRLGESDRQFRRMTLAQQSIGQSVLLGCLALSAAIVGASVRPLWALLPAAAAVPVRNSRRSTPLAALALAPGLQEQSAPLLHAFGSCIGGVVDRPTDGHHDAELDGERVRLCVSGVRVLRRCSGGALWGPGDRGGPSRFGRRLGRIGASRDPRRPRV